MQHISISEGIRALGWESERQHCHSRRSPPSRQISRSSVSEQSIASSARLPVSLVARKVTLGIHRRPGLLGIDRCQGLFHAEAGMKQGSRNICCYKLLATSTVRPEWCFAPVFASAAYGMVQVLLSLSHINLLDRATQHPATSGCSIQPLS